MCEIRLEQVFPEEVKHKYIDIGNGKVYELREASSAFAELLEIVDRRNRRLGLPTNMPRNLKFADDFDQHALGYDKPNYAVVGCDSRSEI